MDYGALEWGLWAQVLVCPLGVRKKVAENMPAAQHSPPIWARSRIMSARSVQAGKYGRFLLAYTEISPGHANALHGISSYYSDEKGLCAARSCLELKC